MTLRMLVAVLLGYAFGALSVTADEIFWLKLDQGIDSVYYFPILGPWKVWAAWDLVFTGLGLCFLLLVVTLAPWKLKLPHLPRLHWRTVETLTIPTQKAMIGDGLQAANEVPMSRQSNEALTGRLPSVQKLVEVAGTDGILERSG